MQLVVRRFAGSTPGPQLLITGAVHGDEFEPVMAIQRLIRLFEAGLHGLDQLRGSVSLVPVVNEAAFLRGQRAAEDGLDLARTCPGNEHGTVTQRTAAALSQLIRESDFYIDLHSGGTVCTVAPLAGYVLHDDLVIRATQQRMAHAFNLPIVWGTSAELQGRSLSVARDAGIPAIYCEYHGAGQCDPQGVEAYVAGCLAVMAELGLRPADRNQPPAGSRVRHFVEDPRPQSGHMQVCHTSPITGLFESAVRLGEVVREGSLLGTVTSLDGRQQLPVSAQQSGMVIVLRTFSRVMAGDSLGVILEGVGVESQATVR